MTDFIVRLFRFKFLRNILIAFLAIAVLIPIYENFRAFPPFLHLLTNAAEDQAIRIATHLSSSDFFKRSPLDSIESISEEWIEEVTQVSRDMKLEKVKVFSKSGEVIFSTNPLDIGKINKNDYFHAIVTDGRVFTKVVEKDAKSLEGRILKKTVVETYVPIIRDNKFVGSFEIYYDIASQYDSLNVLLGRINVDMIIMALCLGILALILVSRASKAMSEHESTLEALKLSEKKLQTSLEELSIHQQVLRETIKDLEMEGHHKSRFLSNMSHELRSPLNSMLILSRLLAENSQGNLIQKQVEFAQTIHSAGSDLLLLIDEVLDLARIAAGRMQVYVDRVQLEEIADVVDKGFRTLAEENGLNFQVEIDSNAQEIIWTDRQRLHQIIKNLIGNALKFTRQGEIRVFFRPLNTEELSHASNSDSHTGCAIDVADTGMGIPEEKRLKIFEPFRQLDDGADRKFQGSGLGLTICQEMAALLGGRINIESQEGKGSVFTIILTSVSQETPIGFKDNQLDSKALKESDLASLRDDRRTLRPYDKSVLVVSQDQNRAYSLCEAAHSMGFGVLVAGDGKAALFLADYYQPSATILEESALGSDYTKLAARLQFGKMGENRPMLFLAQTDHPGIPATSGAYVQNVIIGSTSEPWLMAIPGFFKVMTENLATSGKTENKLEIREVKVRPLAGRNILLIENDVLNIFALTSLLQENGAEVINAKNGSDGQQRLKENLEIDIILAEIMAPDMGGYEFLQKIRDDTKFHSCPIIVVTSLARQGERQRCLEAGASEYMPKPVDSAKLLSMINVLLNEQDLSDETKDLSC